MKRKRLMAGIIAVACSVSVLSSMPFTAAHATDLVLNDFEINYGGWYTESADYLTEVTAIEGIGYGGSRGMLVSGRKAPTDGVVSEKDLYLTGGRKYDYSVRVSAETDQHFKLTLTTVDFDTKEKTVKILDEQDVKGGEWATLGASYKAPKNSYSFKLTITTDSTDDFIYDDVKVTGKAEPMSASAADEGLKDMLVNYGIRSGNILNGGTVDDNGIKQILLKDCNAIECENETKPDATLAWKGAGCTNTDIKVRDDGFAKIADWCAKNGLAFRGHTMVWHSQTPEWFFKENMQSDSGSYVSESVMNQRLESYIKNMFNLYATKYPNLNLYAYDVCNECMNDSNGGPRGKGYGNGNSPWVSVYGDNHFIDKAFEYARKYAPKNCHLFYNDYNEYAGFKRDAILTTAKRIKAAGNLDGVGMQSHINANANDGWSGENAYLTALKMYLQAGLEVQITELDVSTNGGTYSLDQQANRYKNILKACIDWNSDPTHESRVTLFQVWGPNDGHSWVGTDKSTGKSNAPLLYTSNNQPKAAYNALTSLVPKPWGDGTKFSDDFVIQEPELDRDGYWFHYTFENGEEGVEGRSATIATTGNEHYAGSKALEVSGRTASWNGASTTLNSRVFKPGESYSFSVNVKYTGGAASDSFYLSMEYTDASGDTKWPHIAEGTAVSGEWVQLSNTDFTIPSDASNVKIYVETQNETSLQDFYIDEFIGAPKGTVIAGAGKGAQLLLGDVNLDGTVSSADLAAMKAGIKAGKFEKSLAQKNADVDQSRKVDADDAKALDDFLLTKIKEFPVKEPEAGSVDFKTMEAKFSSVNKLTSYKKDNENNPLTTQRFGADPGWMVYGDRLYLYTTNDAFEYYTDGRLQINTYNSGTINCISSADLVNWTDHGAIPVAARNGRTKNGVVSWANNAWAPDAEWKTIDGKDTFFLYFANNGSGIGVLKGSSPYGPFVDGNGQELNKGVSGSDNVMWQFDPGVYYDRQKNEGYLAYGGGVPNGQNSNPGTGRIGKLTDDMCHFDGALTKMQTPYLFEDSSLIKIGDLWYYSYCSNWSGGGTVNGVKFGSADICYMTSTNPLGPWTSNQMSGMVFANTGSQRIDNGGNNHHSIIYFKGKYYVAYHSRQQALRMGITAIDKDHPNDRSKDSKDGNYRSTQLNEASFNNGKISCTGNMTGITKQLEYVNPYKTVQAETMANQSTEIEVNGVGDTTVSFKKAGAWSKVKGVDFANGCSKFTVRASSQSGAVIKVMDGSGNAFAYAEIPGGGSMDEIVFACNSIDGVNDITFEVSGPVEFDSWSFS